MRTFIILSEKSWHQQMFISLQEKAKEDDWILINDNADFNFANLTTIMPAKIFIPHWSYIIPAEVYDNFECVVFHMTDLPFGRGGSPLQNLISRGINDTKISALQVKKDIDSGPVYLKHDLNLNGTAKEIFLRSTTIIEKMILEIINKKLTPVEQKGDVFQFSRRKPEDSNVMDISDINKLFDYIRMLDCEGYPNAFIENENFRFEFTRASIQSDKEIIANVRIIKK